MIENTLKNTNNNSFRIVDKIVLALDGESIILKNALITSDYDLPEEDQSGQSSSTNSSEKGIKPKVLNVKGLIEYSRAEQLSRLIELSYQTEKDGAKKVYRVANATANVINLRQAVFSGKFSISPHTTLLAWEISFTLSERQSVPEKREEREQQRAIENGEQTVDSVGEEIPNEGKEKEELSWFEKNILAKIDNMLG